MTGRRQWMIDAERSIDEDDTPPKPAAKAKKAPAKVKK